MISGHTHHAYVCNIDGRLVTSGDKYGTLVTAIDVKLDPATRDVISAKADNVIVKTSIASDPEQTALLEAYDQVAAPIANRRAGSVKDTLSRVPNLTGESVLGDVIADAQLAATAGEKNGGAVIAMTNPGGIRTDITKKDDGAVSYADVFSSQPFRNQLVTLTLSGAQLKTALEQQWTGREAPARAAGLQGIQLCLGRHKTVWRTCRCVSMMLNGAPVDPAKELSHHHQQLPRARRRRLRRIQGRHGPCNSASTTSTRCSPISRPTARSRPRRRCASRARIEADRPSKAALQPLQP